MSTEATPAGTQLDVPRGGWKRKTKDEQRAEAIECWRLRTQERLNVGEIEQETGLSHGTVITRLKMGAALAVVPDVEQYRAESQERIDKYVRAFLNGKKYLSAKDLEALMKSEDQTAKLWGLYTPVTKKIELDVRHDGPIEDEALSIARELGLVSETEAYLAGRDDAEAEQHDPVDS